MLFGPTHLRLLGAPEAARATLPSGATASVSLPGGRTGREERHPRAPCRKAPAPDIIPAPAARTFPRRLLMDTLHSQLTALVAYTDWANHRMFADLVGLDGDEWVREVGGSFGTVQNTAAHIVSSEWVWLERWNGRSPTRAPEWILDPDPKDLCARWMEVAGDRRAWLGGRTAAELVDELTYTRIGGETHTDRLDVLVRHVVNHSTYHRGQIAAFLRNLGRTPTSTDLVLWARERGAERPAP